MGFLALFVFVLGAPLTALSTNNKGRSSEVGTARCNSPVTLNSTSNPFEGRKLFPASSYRETVLAAADRIADPVLKTKTTHVADVGAFLWLDNIASIGKLVDEFKQVSCVQIIGLVLNDIPGRDCTSLHRPENELTLSQYKTSYIDEIAQVVEANPNVAIALIVEPKALTDIIVNANLQTCGQAIINYEEGIAYAIRRLDYPNVVQYVDAGHGGWLGWVDNIEPAASKLAKVFKTAGSPSSVRGFATNVASYNAWIMEPGEFEDEPDALYNKAQDERRFVNLFAAALQNVGFPNHAIVDTNRNGVQGIRLEWGDWCNVNGAGFGTRPTVSINSGSGFLDAFVWVKHGGVSDGTSDSHAFTYDSYCGKNDAFKPSGEAGSWNQAYFEMLLQNAHPEIN